jgi:hypothetical protein
LYTKALSKMRAIIKNKKLLRTIQLNYKIHWNVSAVIYGNGEYLMNRILIISH